LNEINWIVKLKRETTELAMRVHLLEKAVKILLEAHSEEAKPLGDSKRN